MATALTAACAQSAPATEPPAAHRSEQVSAAPSAPHPLPTGGGEDPADWTGRIRRTFERDETGDATAATAAVKHRAAAAATKAAASVRAVVCKKTICAITLAFKDQTEEHDLLPLLYGPKGALDARFGGFREQLTTTDGTVSSRLYLWRGSPGFQPKDLAP